MVTVDVEGRVRRPGIVILPAGSRVTDALDAAGGVPHRRALRGLNLAAVLTDGQQIMVGQKTSQSANLGPTSIGASPAGASPAGGAPVNLNTATAEQLDTLPDVGPVTAQSIIEWRAENGGFTSVQELLVVDGIGPVTMKKLAPHVTV
jgi:competence protein ComEA